MILGIPIVAILMVVVTSVGLWHVAKFIVAKHYEVKREKATAKRDADRIHKTLDYCENAHKHLTDPDLQAATAKEIADKIKSATKGLEISKQFEQTAGPATS